jgi:pimeloyl-ACP methyl ester carboxylesterase
MSHPGVWTNNEITPAADGTDLAYALRGEGPGFFLFNGFTTTNHSWGDVLPWLARRGQVLSWDYKGHGHSGAARNRGSASLEAAMDDARRVMDAAALGPATLVGYSLGCQMALEFYRRNPERVRALVLLLGTYKSPFDTLFHPSLGQAVYRFFERTPAFMLRQFFRGMPLAYKLPGRRAISGALRFHAHTTPDADLLGFMEHFATIDPVSVAGLGCSAQQHSAEDLLPQVKVPTLVVAGGADVFTPESLSRHMHQAIPEAEMLFLPDGHHTGMFDMPEIITSELGYFLDRLGLCTPPEKR